MKSILVIPAILLAGLSARADFNSDSPGKSVRCTGTGTVVIADKARKVIKVIDLIDPGHPSQYKIVHRESDGDTETTYTSDRDEVELTFSDRGDTLVYTGPRPTVLPLTCP